MLTGLYNFNADDLRQMDPLFRTLNVTMQTSPCRFEAHYVNLFSAAARRSGPDLRPTPSSAARATDPIPTDAGYRAIADAVWKATRY